MKNLQASVDSDSTHETTESNREAGFTSPTTARVIRSVLIFAMAGVVFYGVATLAGDYHSVFNALASFPGTTFGLVMTLVVIGWLLRGWRFYYYLQKSGEDIPLGYSLSAFLAAFALTGTPGKVGGSG
jgi:uncharacterized membrane protein YbhN (UPF0104 family)